MQSHHERAVAENWTRRCAHGLGLSVTVRRPLQLSPLQKRQALPWAEGPAFCKAPSSPKMSRKSRVSGLARVTASLLRN